MDFEKIKEKLPFLRNVDFHDPRTRKNVILAVVFSLAVICMLLMSGDGDSKSEPLADQATSSSTMDMPQGEDNDVLHSDNVLDARRNSSQRSYADIYDDGMVSQEDPMALPSRNGSGQSSDLQRDVFADTEDMIRRAAQGDRSGETPPPQQSSSSSSSSGGGGGGGYSGGSSYAQTSQQAAAVRAEQRKREMMREAGLLDENGNRTYNPKDALGVSSEDASVASVSSASASVTSPVQQPAEEPVIATSTVRRSGDISAMSSGSNNSGNLSSLRKKDQYVTTDQEHLFKVMFPTSEKIVSGQRVSLRLLEDMVVDGVLVPANTYLSSIVTFDQRLTVTVSSIEFNGKIHPIRYEGYDTDGMRGLYCPVSNKEEVKKDAGREVRNIGSSLLGSSVTSVASQLVNSGVSLMEKAKGQQEISITAGYTFFLRKIKENQ